MTPSEHFDIADILRQLGSKHGKGDPGKWNVRSDHLNRDIAVGMFGRHCGGTKERPVRAAQLIINYVSIASYGAADPATVAELLYHFHDGAYGKPTEMSETQRDEILSGLGALWNHRGVAACHKVFAECNRMLEQCGQRAECVVDMRAQYTFAKLPRPTPTATKMYLEMYNEAKAAGHECSVLLKGVDVQDRHVDGSEAGRENGFRPNNLISTDGNFKCTTNFALTKKSQALAMSHGGSVAGAATTFGYYGKQPGGDTVEKMMHGVVSLGVPAGTEPSGAIRVGVMVCVACLSFCMVV